MKSSLMALLLFAVGGVRADDPTISITATPRYPWNGKVDLKFTIGADETEGGYAAHEIGDDAIAGYRLKYVQSAGDAQLNTGVVPGSKNTIELKFAFDGTPESVNQCLYCARGETTATASYTAFLLGGKWRFDYNSVSGTERATPTPVGGVPMVIRTVAGSATVDGVAVQSYTAEDFTVGGQLALFSSYVEAPGTRLTNYLKGKIYYLKIFGDDGMTLLHDFVPWEKDGVVGMHDMIARCFVAPNVGTLTCGTRGTKYDTSFTAKDVAGGTNLTMKTLYKSNGAAVNVGKEALLPGTYNWVWDAAADLGEGTVLEKVVVEGKTVFPYWYVKFNANGGTGTMANETFELDVAKALTANAFTRTGYTFQGWATSAIGAKVYSDKQSVSNLTATASGTVNLYAVWKANAYSVKFNANGGTGTMANESFTYGTAKALTANAFTRTGFAFDGWAKSASGTKAYSDKQSVSNLTATAGGTFNLYAVWKATGGVQLWANGPYWAECNVGATKPEEYGYYFSWGDTKGYKRVGSSWNAVDGSKTGFSFSRGNCPTYGKSLAQLKSAGYVDSTTGNLVAAHDAATAYLGAPWRMPTYDEISDLISNCTTTWTTRNGVYGRLVTGKGAYASKSIFLPAAGCGYDSSLNDPGSYGSYWTSTPEDYTNIAEGLHFYSGSFYWNGSNRFYGRSVRPLRGFAQ